MFLCTRSLRLSSVRSKPVSRQYHHLRSTRPGTLPRLGAGAALVTGVAAATAFTFSELRPKYVYADVNDDTSVEGSSIRSAPLTSLLRSYLVFSVCSVPAFVDWSPHVLSFMAAVPGLKQLAAALVRRSFFAQVRIHIGRGYG